MALECGTTEGGTEHVGFICHKQPVLERAIRGIMDANPLSELRVSSTIISTREDEDFVYVEYIGADKTTTDAIKDFWLVQIARPDIHRRNTLSRKISSWKSAHNQWNIPASSIVSLGTDLGRTSYEEAWVALNWQILLPTRETHPDLSTCGT